MVYDYLIKSQILYIAFAFLSNSQFNFWIERNNEKKFSKNNPKINSQIKLKQKNMLQKQLRRIFSIC